MDRRTVTASLLALLVGGCGGGGTGGSPTGPIAAAPTPTPTPTVTPTPMSTVPTYRAATTAPLAVQYRFYQTAAFTDQLSSPYGTRDGYIGPNRLPFQTGTIGTTAGTESQWKLAAGINVQTSQYFVVHGRPTARALTPVSSLLVRHADAARLKRQLGITGSLFAMTSEPDLDLYEAQAELATGDTAHVADAERFIAAILRVQAIEAATLGFGGFGSPDQFLALGERLNAAGDTFIFTNERMSALLAGTPKWQNVREDVRSAAAHLINAFAAAIGTNVSSDRAARYSLACVGYLAAELDALARNNTEAAAAVALQVTAPMIESETIRYGERIPVTATGFFFPAPDFYRLEAARSSVIETVKPGASQFFLNGNVVDLPQSNDLTATSSGSPGFYLPAVTIESITLPAGNAREISINRDAEGKITVTPVLGFVGLTYLDYVARNVEGETQVARIYLRIV